MPTEAPPAPPAGAPPAGTPPAGAPPNGHVDTTPFFASWVGQNGELNHGNYSKLPEDIRHVGDSVSKYKTVEDFLRGHAHLQHLAGQKNLVPLPENASPEARAQRKQVLDGINGVPKELKDYGLVKPEKLPEGVEWNDKRAQGFATWAHENSVSPAAAKKLFDWYLSEVGSDAKGYADYRDNFFMEQSKAWDGIVAKERIAPDEANALVDRGARELGLNLEDAAHQGLLKNAAVRNAMMRHAMATREDSPPSTGSGTASEGSPRAQAEDIMHNKANPLYEALYNSQHPQHRLAKEKVDQLMRAAVGGRR